ncbi:MAG: hypothetical protein LBB53_06630 [Prevotellaceae bacterium]|jgi:fructose-1,6-bisphosphatase/inositol monophosphatase family enzyme|nr:hypothetical protein [Prevotellaceae bacterium]
MKDFYHSEIAFAKKIRNISVAALIICFLVAGLAAFFELSPWLCVAGAVIAGLASVVFHSMNEYIFKLEEQQTYKNN